MNTDLKKKILFLFIIQSYYYYKKYFDNTNFHRLFKQKNHIVHRQHIKLLQTVYKKKRIN